MTMLLLLAIEITTPALAGPSAPPRARYQYILANYLLHRGDTAAAMTAADIALLHDPKAAAPRILKAHLARSEGRSDEALAILEEAARLSPASVEVWRELAALRGARGDTYGAAAAGAKAATLSGNAALPGETPRSGG